MNCKIEVIGTIPLAAVPAAITVTTDPKQVGATADGFPIAPESSAWKTGFKPIPFEQIGLHPNPDRARLAQFE